MPKTSVGAVAMSLVLSVGVAAQGAPQSADSAQAADSAQGMMQQMQERMQGMQQMMQGMQERMQSMQQMMQQMHGQPGAQGTQAMQGMQDMQGMAGPETAAQAGTCIMRGPDGALSALLFGSVADLGLTEEQRTRLEEILARAQTDALDALTGEQRARLEDAPQAGSGMCRQAQPTTGGGGG